MTKRNDYKIVHRKNSELKVGKKHWRASRSMYSHWQGKLVVFT